MSSSVDGVHSDFMHDTFAHLRGDADIVPGQLQTTTSRRTRVVDRPPRQILDDLRR